MVANEQRPDPKCEPGGKSKLWLFDFRRGVEIQLAPRFLTAGYGSVDFDIHGFVYFSAKEMDVLKKSRKREKYIAYAGANVVYGIDHDGSGLLRILNTPKRGEADVSISEDGSFITHVSRPITPSHPVTEIWVAESSGSNARRVYKSGKVIVASAHDPELSPDTSQIIFSIVNSEVPPNFPKNPDANTAHDIWPVNLDRTDLELLTGPGPISVTPDWKDDTILYLDISERDRYAGILLISANKPDQIPVRIRRDANIGKWIP